MKAVIYFSLVLLLTSSCFMSKTVQLAKGGELKTTSVYKEFDFEYFKGMIYVPVQIKGKTYNFIFDSGAFMNVISVELAAEQNKTVVMQPQSSGSNVMTIYDPVRDNRALIRQGQRMISGACTLGINC